CCASLCCPRDVSCPDPGRSRTVDTLMSSVLLDPVELRRQGFEALVRSLGWVNAVRFLQQYETSRLDYTAEREHLLPNWDADTLVKKLYERGARKGLQPEARPASRAVISIS